MRNYTLADYVIIYKKDVYAGDELRNKFYEDLKANKSFKLLETSGDIEVYKKTVSP